MNYKEITGDLIELALEGKFDVIAHGCNCFNTMGAGIAAQFKDKFTADKFPIENNALNKGNINLLGLIDFKGFSRTKAPAPASDNSIFVDDYAKHIKVLYVVNCYTQYRYGKQEPLASRQHLDYAALTLCMRKLNHTFKGKHIGLPLIGCGLAGGDWETVKKIIQRELKDCSVTIVYYDK